MQPLDVDVRRFVTAEHTESLRADVRPAYTQRAGRATRSAACSSQPAGGSRPRLLHVRPRTSPAEAFCSPAVTGPAGRAPDQRRAVRVKALSGVLDIDWRSAARPRAATEREERACPSGNGCGDGFSSPGCCPRLSSRTHSPVRARTSRRRWYGRTAETATSARRSTCRATTASPTVRSSTSRSSGCPRRTRNTGSEPCS